MIHVLLQVVERRRLIAVLVAVAVAVGAVGWTTMPRQEDPSFAERYASLVVPWPGADPQHVERLVVRPIEDALADVPEIKEISATARSHAAVFRLELRDTIYETETPWDEVRNALDQVQPLLPPAAGPLRFNTKAVQPASVVLLVTGPTDLLTLRAVARDLQDDLAKVTGVARVERIADPGEQVSIRVEPGLAHRLGLDPQSLAAMLRSRNAVLPSGNLYVGGRSAVLSPRSELLDMDAIRRTPWVLPDGSAVPLQEIAEIVQEPASPAETTALPQRPARRGVGHHA